MLNDLRYAVRILLKSPGFTAVAAITLALGIGANSAVFSVVNSVLLQPLPYEEPDRLVMVGETRQGSQEPTNPSYPNFVDWRDRNHVFRQMAACAPVSFSGPNFDLTGVGQPERITGLRVSTNFFPLVGVNPILGRGFLQEEEQAGRHRVVLMSYSLWQRRFAGDPNILGKALTLNGEPYILVGIMPANFQFTPFWFQIKADLWVPLTPDTHRRRGYLYVLARLKPGITMSQAQADMDTIARSLEQQYPESDKGRGVKLVPLHEQLAQINVTRPALLPLLAAVGFVLLIACANVASLLLARGTARQRETAIRAALGASRWQIVRQLLSESLLLALLGGLVGLLLAAWGVDLLAAGIPPEIGGFLPNLKSIHVDLNVLSFTGGVSLLTALIFGLAPALQSSKLDLNESLKEAGRSSTGGPGRNRFRSALVIWEISLALVLLIGAGLMINSFLRLQAVRPGFAPENLLSVRVNLPGPKYPEESHRRAIFYQQVLEKMESLPGVISAGAINTLPISGERLTNRFAIEGRPEVSGEDLLAGYCSISPNYFSTMRIPLLKGRQFAESDNQDSPRVVIINETLARRFWPDKDPIGKRLRIGGGDGEPGEIVGVVSNVRHLGLDSDPRPEIYVPLMQGSDAYMYLVIRTAVEPTSLGAAMRSAVWAIDKELPVDEIRTVKQVISDSVAPRRFAMVLLGIFASLALILAVVGIYGVMSYFVTQQTHEIGIRMALGAQRNDVLKLVVRQGMILAIAGVAIGVVLGLVVTRVISGFLYGVTATDPATFAAVSLSLMAATLLASYIPARRATKVDPMVALRYE